MAGVIDAYLQELSGHLRHDPALARRMRAEIADHFAEMLGDVPSDEEARRAVARMGPARAIAATLIADGADRQADRTFAVLLAALLATFVAMRLRTLWLPPIDTDGSFAGLAAPFVDRWSFVAAIAAGAGGYWLARRTGRTAAIAGRATAVALAGLSASVAAGLLRIWLAGDWSTAPTMVSFATIGECLLVGLLMAQMLALRRDARRAAALTAG